MPTLHETEPCCVRALADLSELRREEVGQRLVALARFPLHEELLEAEDLRGEERKGDGV